MVCQTMEYPSNVILLLLQLLLQRQQTLSHQDKSLNLTELLKDPIVDKEVLVSFQSHKLVKMYSPDLCYAHLRSLKSLVSDIFMFGVPSDETDEGDPITVITLANHYYKKRLKELEQEQLPQLRQEMVELFNDAS